MRWMQEMASSVARDGSWVDFLNPSRGPLTAPRHPIDLRKTADMTNYFGSAENR